VKRGGLSAAMLAALSAFGTAAGLAAESLGNLGAALSPATGSRASRSGPTGARAIHRAAMKKRMRARHKTHCRGGR
jgi:hypothetical protein